MSAEKPKVRRPQPRAASFNEAAFIEGAKQSRPQNIKPPRVQQTVYLENRKAVRRWCVEHEKSISDAVNEALRLLMKPPLGKTG